LVNLPIWAFHGEEDQTVPLAASKTMVDAVKKCGGHVEFTVYPQCDHGVCDLSYGDGRLYNWLLAQRRQHQPRPNLQEKGDRK
jgi:predicted peptidase